MHLTLTESHFIFHKKMSSQNQPRSNQEDNVSCPNHEEDNESCLNCEDNASCQSFPACASVSCPAHASASCPSDASHPSRPVNESLPMIQN